MINKVKTIALALAVATTMGSATVATSGAAQASNVTAEVLTVAVKERRRGFRRGRRHFRRHRFFRRHRHWRRHRHFRRHWKFGFHHGCGMKKIWSDYHGRFMWVRPHWCY